MHDPDRPKRMFVDRVSEADALRKALERHRARIDTGDINTDSLRNVLTFYGEGGVGKTELSNRLAEWVQGDGGHNRGWGWRPETAVDAVVRWDVHDSGGGLDPLPLLEKLRFQLGGVQATWPPFDLAFGAYYRALRPGEELSLKQPSAGLTTLSDVLGGLVGDAIGSTDVAVSGGISSGVLGIGKSLISAAVRNSRARRAMSRYSGLEDLIRRCETLSGGMEESAEAAGRVAFMLTRQIEAMEPSERPTIVVFVDHMERLQSIAGTHQGESVLNRLVVCLPYVLFVVAGRSSLQWHDPQFTGVAFRGGRVWPYLSVESPPDDEPRQHRVDNLSPEDALIFLKAACAAEGIEISDAAMDHIVSVSDGRPLHLDTVIAVAVERWDGDELDASDLAVPLPSLVERLLRDLPADVADAFRAACLLPYFNLELVAAAGELHQGSVERLVRRTIVRPNPSSPYPFRVHDTLRDLVRSAGAAAAGGWSDVDWKRHARLAIAEGKRWFEAAMGDEDDLTAVHSLALVLNVAEENDVWDDWIVAALRRAPTVAGLASVVPAKARASTPIALRDTVEYIQIRARAQGGSAVADDYLPIIARGTPIAGSAGLFRAYDLRRRGRYDDAVEQLEDLANAGVTPRICRNQIVTTLRIARRFQQALDRFDLLDDVQQENTMAAIRRGHGDLAGADIAVRRRMSDAGSRRFEIELTGDWLVLTHLEHGVTVAEVEDVRRNAAEVGSRDVQSQTLGVLAEMHLFNDQVFTACIRDLEELSRRRYQPAKSLVSALVLRAWATRDADDVARARAIASQASCRGVAWVGVEILLEDMGAPLPAVPVEWLEPYDVVRDRWLAAYAGVVNRARREAGPGPSAPIAAAPNRP